MPSSDYTTTGGGLKLKGVKNAGVDKKRKKKKAASAPNDTDQSPHNAGEADLERALRDEDDAATPAQTDRDEDGGADKDIAGPGTRAFGKTEAELRHEERRKKRLDERLKREGVKTHKERVEALNKYLSNLSEHHDMPRIGPG